MIRSLADLCQPVVEQCDPAQAGTRVYVGLEHLDPGVSLLTRIGSPSEIRSVKTRFQAGDVLYGKLRPYLDKAILAPFDGICSTDILVLRPSPEVLARYLVGLLHTPQFVEHATQNTHGVNHPRTSWTAISSFTWDVPSLSEQESIGDLLRKAERALLGEKRLVAAAQELKQAAMRRLFTRGLRGEAQKESDIGPVPEGWGLKHVAEIVDNLRYGTSVKCDRDHGVPVLRIPNVVDGRVVLDDLKRADVGDAEHDRLRLADGDVLFVRTNGVRERVGSTAVYHGQPEIALFASYLIRARVRQGAIDPDFLHFFAMSSAGRAQLSERSTPAADGKFNLNAKTIGSMIVPVPGESEQREIVSILDTIDRRIALHERKRAVLQDLFDTLLHDLMTGRLRVADVELDGASENVDVTARAVRRAGMRVRRLDLHDGEPDDDAAARSAADRLGTMWQLARDAWAFTDDADRAESRLQRHALRVRRGGR